MANFLVEFARAALGSHGQPHISGCIQGSFDLEHARPDKGVDLARGTGGEA